MKLLPQVRRTPLVLVVGLLTALTSGAQQLQRRPLQLTLTQLPAATRLHFQAELHNTGKLPLTLNLGFTMRGKQYPTAIHLLLTDADSKTLLLDVLPRGVIGGMPDPFVVPLAAGATIAVPIHLEDYSASQEKMWQLVLPPGQYTLRAEYTVKKTISPMPYWTGTVDSNTLAFTLAQEVARQHGH